MCMLLAALNSGLEIDPVNGGVVVNGQLEAVSGIYAAGACASYYDQVKCDPICQPVPGLLVQSVEFPEYRSALVVAHRDALDLIHGVLWMMLGSFPF